MDFPTFGKHKINQNQIDVCVWFDDENAYEAEEEWIENRASNLKQT